MNTQHRELPTADGIEEVCLDAQVYPLLDAIIWIGQASNKLDELHSAARYDASAKRLDSIPSPLHTTPGTLVCDLAWLVQENLRRYVAQGGQRVF